MAKGVSRFLRYSLLLLLIHPLNHSSRPEQDVGTSCPFPRKLKLDPEPTPWVGTALVTWIYQLAHIVATGITFGRWLWRCWRKKRQSPSARAEPCGRQGCDCQKKVMQLLRQMCAMLPVCLRHSFKQALRAKKKAAEWGIWKRKRLPASLQS